MRFLLVALAASVAAAAVLILVGTGAEADTVGVEENTWGVGSLTNGTYQNLSTDGTLAKLSKVTHSHAYDSWGDFNGTFDGTAYLNGTGLGPILSSAGLVRWGNFTTAAGTNANWIYSEYNTGVVGGGQLNPTGGVGGGPCYEMRFSEGDPGNGYLLVQWLNQTFTLSDIPFHASLSLMHLFGNWTEGDFLPGCTVSLLLRDPSGAVHLVDERAGLVSSDPSFVPMGGDVTSLIISPGHYTLVVRVSSDSTGNPSAVSAIGSVNRFDDASLTVEWYPALSYYVSPVVDFGTNCTVTIDLLERTLPADSFVTAYVRLAFGPAELVAADWDPVLNNTSYLSGSLLQFRVAFSCSNSTRAASLQAFGFRSECYHESGWFQTDAFAPPEVDMWLGLTDYAITWQQPGSRSLVQYSVDGGTVFHDFDLIFEHQEFDHGIMLRVLLWTLDTRHTPSVTNITLRYIPRNVEPVASGIADLECIPAGSSRELTVNFTNAGGPSPWWKLAVRWSGLVNVTVAQAPLAGNVTLSAGSAEFEDFAPMPEDSWMTVRLLVSMPADAPDWSLSNITAEAMLMDLGTAVAVAHRDAGDIRSISPILSVAVDSGTGVVEDYDTWPSKLTVVNSGHGNATGVLVEVNTSSTEMKWSDREHNLTSSGWSFSIPWLGPGSQTEIHFDSAFAGSAANGSWSLQAVVVSGHSDAGLSTSANTSIASKRLLLLPSVSWNVTGWDATLSPGDTATMKLELANAGPGEAHDVLVLIGQENFGAYCLRVLVDDLDGYDNMNVYHARPESLAPGTYVVRFNLTVTASYPYLVSGTPLNVSVILGWNDALGGHRSDALAFEASAAAMAPTPMVALATPSPASVEMGRTVELLVNASNAGTGTLWGARVVICLPSDIDLAEDAGWTRFFDFVPYGMTGWAYPVGNISAGGSVLAPVSLLVDQNARNGTLLTAVAFLSDGGIHSELFQPRQAFSVVPLSRSYLDLGMSVPKDAILVNGSVVVTFTYTNNGTGPASEVAVNVSHLLLSMDSATAEPAVSGGGWSLFRFADVAPGRHDLVVTFVGIAVGNATIDATLAWSDPNYGQSSVSLPFSGTVVVQPVPLAPRETERTFLEAIYWPWLPLGVLLASLLLLAGFLVYYRSLTHVKEVYLGYRDGRLIMHRLAPGMESSPLDKDIVSTMIQAMQNFVKDTFAGGDADYMRHMEFGNNGLLIERGELIFVAAIHDGPPQKWLRSQLHDKVAEFEAKHAKTLAGWDGDVSKFDDDDIADLFG